MRGCAMKIFSDGEAKTMVGSAHSKLRGTDVLGPGNRGRKTKRDSDALRAEEAGPSLMEDGIFDARDSRKLLTLDLLGGTALSVHDRALPGHVEEAGRGGKKQVSSARRAKVSVEEQGVLNAYTFVVPSSAILRIGDDEMNRLERPNEDCRDGEVRVVVVGRSWEKVDRGTADETKQLWRGRRGRRMLVLIFALCGGVKSLLARLQPFSA